MKRILSLVLTLSMLLSCVLLAEAEAPAKLSICSPDNTFGLSTDPELQQAVVNMQCRPGSRHSPDRLL